MFKFLVLVVFLCQNQIKESFGEEQNKLYDAQLSKLTVIAPPPNNDSSMEFTPEMNGKNQFFATQQFFIMHGNFLSRPLPSTPNVDMKINLGYTVTEGIGALKLHRDAVEWNQARKICISEGGHLAIIRTDSEEKIIQKMMTDNSVDTIWVGYHDEFNVGEWVTILDEPIEKAGWSRWSTKFTPNPSGQNQHCAQFIDEGGIDDFWCDNKKSFICKILTL